MIAEAEARTRAEYMGLVHRQLEILRERRDLAPGDYLELLRSSSLRLAEIEWVHQALQDAVRSGRIGETLDRLILYYEGYFEALARVLEVKPDVLLSTFDRARVAEMEGEMRRRLR